MVYEVAQQLRAQGEDVAYLAMLDAVLPGPGLRGRFARFLRLLDLGGRAGAQLLRKSLTRRSRRLLRSHRSAEFGQFQGERLGSMELMREDAYRESAAEYAAAVEPWPLPVTLIVAGKRLDDDPLQPADCGWSQHAARLRTHIVDSEHLELLQRPWVDQVAEILAEGLQCASSVADPSRARSRDSGVADDRLRRRSDILRGTGD